LNRDTDNKLLAAIAENASPRAADEARQKLVLMEDSIRQRFCHDDAGETERRMAELLMNGGKKLRPLLVALSASVSVSAGTTKMPSRGAKKVAADNEKADGEKAASEAKLIRFMTAVEMIHTASLLHDDIVDRSTLRRGFPTLWAAAGDAEAVRCGIMMMAYAAELCAEDEDEALALLTDIPRQMCLGELRQLEIAGDEHRQTKYDYMQRIAQKTGALIEGSCLLGAIAAGADDRTKKALSEYGQALGIIFQLRDDLLDLEAVPTDGKPVAQDVERGYYTLPLIHGLFELPAVTPTGKRLRSILCKHKRTAEESREILALVEETGGIKYTRRVMSKKAKLARIALEGLPDGDARLALTAIVNVLTDDSAGN
jgi:heptaprenyl diphosphate synthase